MSKLDQLDREDIKICLNKYNNIIKKSLLAGQKEDLEGTDLFYIHKTVEYLIEKI